MNVFDYYVYRLNDTPDDQKLAKLEIDSLLGDDCKRIIDAAEVLLYHLHRAYSKFPNSRLEQGVLLAVNSVVSRYSRYSQGEIDV
jgi:hypothetical protein